MNFETAYRENFSWLVNAISAKTSRHAAEEIVQETFTYIFPKWHQYDPTRPIRPWLYKCAFNRFIDYCRRETRNERIRQAGRRWTTGATVEDAIAKERHPGEGVVWKEAIQRLPEKEKAVIAARIEGHSIREAGQKLGISKAEVYRRLALARNRLSA